MNKMGIGSYTRCIPRLILALCLWSAVVNATENQTVGWRGNGTGQFPLADPPTTWSSDKNIIWSTPMPSWSNSSPIIVGDRLFVCSEPATLVCCNLVDGKILWKKENTFRDCASEDERVKIQQAESIQDEIDKAKVEEFANKLKLEAEDRREVPPDQQDPALKKSTEDIAKKQKELQAKLAPFLGVQPGMAHMHYPTAGYSTPTPVSDGTCVYIHAANRIVACYDMDGNRKWSHITEQISDGWRGHSTTPLLMGDRLFVHVRDLVAYDTKTGKELWRVQTPWDYCSLLGTKIGETEVVISPKGVIVAATDGKILGNVGSSGGAATPVVKDGIVYVLRKNGIVAKLPAKIDLPFKLERICRFAAQADSYSSAVILDGLGYTAYQKEEPGKVSILLQVSDVATGALVYEKDLRYELKANMLPYPSVSQAGKYVFLSYETGETVVIEAGREYKEVARNKLGDGFRSCLVFNDKRLYIRGMKNLYCIGQ